MRYVRVPKGLLSLLLCGVFSGCTLKQVTRTLSGRAPVPPEPVPSVAPPEEVEVDNRPYEFQWKERTEPHKPLITFDSEVLWELSPGNDTNIFFSASSDRQLFGKYTGRFTWDGVAGHSEILINPRREVTVDRAFDCVGLWVLMTNRSHGVSVRLELEGTGGEINSVSVPVPPCTSWQYRRWLLHEDIRPPVKVRYLGLTIPSGSGGSAYLDSIALYKQQHPALPVARLPARPYAQLAEVGETQNSGDEKLDFPASETLMRPLPVREEKFVCALQDHKESTVAFRYEDKTETILYRLDPDQGLASLTASWNGFELGPLLRFFNHGLVEQETGQRVERREKNRLRLQYENGTRLDCQLFGKCLQVDLVIRGQPVRRIDLGRIETPYRTTRIPVPFLRAGEGEALPVYLLHPSTNVSEGVFCTVFNDLHLSSAGEVLYPEAHGPPGRHLSLLYPETTEGEYNDVTERIYITLSGTLEDALPRIPNPPATHLAQARQHAWAGFFGGETRHTLDETRTCLALGLENLLVGGDRTCWSCPDGSGSIRTRVSPLHRGNHALRLFMNRLDELGIRIGLYENFWEISPLNKLWNEEALNLDADENWVGHNPGHYTLKSHDAVHLGNQVSMLLRERFNARAAYLDEHARHAPWRNLDFDPRRPAAGSFSQVMYNYGLMMRQNSRALGGPLFGPGGAELCYAGLQDAFIPELSFADVHPFLPVFLYNHVLPVSEVYGLGSPTGLFDPDSVLDKEEKLDRTLAAQIAYATGIRLADTEAENLLTRSYYMTRDLLQRTGRVPPQRLSYRDTEGKLISTSAALANGVYRRSQVYLYYPSGLEVWVNGSPSENWDVRIGSTRWRLPPFGWVAIGKEFREFSGLHEDHRVDFLETPERIYFDGRGSDRLFEGLASTQPFVIRRLEEDPARVEILTTRASTAIRIALSRLPLKLETGLAWNRDGEPVEDFPCRLEDGIQHLGNDGGASRLLFELDEAAEEP